MRVAPSRFRRVCLDAFAQHGRGMLLLAALLAAPALQTSANLSGDDWLPITPEELKMTSEPLAPGAAAICLYRQVDRDDISAHEANYKRIKILTDEGRKYGDVEIRFFREEGNINAIHARTIQPDGTVTNFDGKVYVKSIVKARGLSYLAKTFTLPNVQAGTIIEYRYSFDWNPEYVYDSRWVLSDELFTKRAVFSLKPNRLFSLNTSWPRGLPPGTAPPKVESGRPIHLETLNVPAAAIEDYMPPQLETMYRVDFSYSEGGIESDFDKFWKQEGKKRYAKLEDFTGKHKAMEQAVAQIVSAGDSPQVKLQKIYARCQKIRNLSYEPDRAQQERDREKLKDVKNVEDIWKLGYGDGTGITWLFLSLARAAELDAYPVIVSRRSDFFFNPRAMNPRQLNDNVVLVMVDGKEQYFDPGTIFTPFGLLPWSETGVAGLKLTKDGGVWVKTPLPDSSASRVERSATLKMDDHGVLAGTLTARFTGLKAQGLRMAARETDATERQKQLEDEVKSWIPIEVEVALKSQPDWDSASDVLQADFSLTVRGWVTGAGRRAFLPVGLFSAEETHLFEHAERVHPIFFEYPWQEKDDVAVQLPLDITVASLPEGKTLDMKAVAFQTGAANDAGTLHLKRSVILNATLVDTKFYPNLRTFFQELRTGDQQQVLLQAGGKSAPGN